MTTYLPAIAIVALLYGTLGLSLNLQVGHTGIINFGHIAFFGIGAYTTAMLTKSGLPVVLGILAGAVMSALCALPIGWIATRLTSHYLAIVTIGFGIAVHNLLGNVDFFGGPSGISGVPRPFGTSAPVVFNLIWMLIAVVLAVVTYVLVRLVTSGVFGLNLRAIKDDEPGALMTGRNLAAFKTAVLVMGSGLAGAAGAVYAHWIGFVQAEQFDALITFYLWAGIIIGGARHVGAFLGCAFVAIVIESTRYLSSAGMLPLTSGQFAAMRWVIVGIALIISLRLRPQGFFPIAASGVRRRTKGELDSAKDPANA